MSKSSAPSYTQRIEAIKRFVDWKPPKKPTAYAKRKAKALFETLFGYTVRKGPLKGEHVPGLFNPRTDVPIRPRNAKQAKLLRESEGQPYHRGIKVVFVESQADENGKLIRPKLSFRGGKVTKTVKQVEEEFFPFPDYDGTEDFEDFARRQARAIARQNREIKSWKVKCGKRQMQSSFAPSGIPGEVARLAEKYENSSDWLTGLVAFRYQSNRDFKSFQREREALRKKQGKGKSHGKNKTRRRH